MDNDTLLVVGIIVGTVVILDIIFLAVIFNTRRKMNAAKAWPSVMGTVNNSYLELRRSSNNTNMINYPVVQYSYQVGGRSYQGSRIAPGPEVGGTGAGKIIERYPVNSQVTVYYNSQNPSDAVLETKAPSQWIMWLVLVIINVMLGGMAALFAFTL